MRQNEGAFRHEIKVKFKFKFDVENVKQQQLNGENRLFKLLNFGIRRFIGKKAEQNENKTDGWVGVSVWVFFELKLQTF